MIRILCENNVLVMKRFLSKSKLKKKNFDFNFREYVHRYFFRNTVHAYTVFCKISTKCMKRHVTRGPAV